MKKIAILFIPFLFITPVFAISVGTAPGVYDLGDVKPGSDNELTFYLLTNSRNDLLVSLGYIDVHPSIYLRNQTGRYTFIPAESSQEDISSWVEIKRTPVLISSSRVKTVQLKGGARLRVNEEAKLIIHVPKNADPGYHIGAINLGPQVVPGVGGTGVATIGVTRFVFVFRVIGKATRDGKIINIVGDRVNEDKVVIDVLFKNTGSCTLNARVSSLEIFDKDGNCVANLKSGYKRIKPGDIQPLPVIWNGGGSGGYRAEATVDYTTGHSFMQSGIEIPVIVRVKPVVVAPKPGKAGFPCNTLLWLIAILIIAALIIYYIWDSGGYRDIILLIIAALVIISIVLLLLNCTLFTFGIPGIDFNIIVVVIILLLIIYYMWG